MFHRPQSPSFLFRLWCSKQDAWLNPEFMICDDYEIDE
ncbi:hypothetical protein ES705_31283 [subsurface metagenome]